MIQVTDEMASEYQRIYARAAEDPGTAGDEGEGNWASLFRDWLPPTYHVETKGRLIGVDGTMSPQIDVIVLKPSYPRKLLEKKVWLADGVAAAFECKTTLKATHVGDSVARCRQFKDLVSPQRGSPYRELASPLLYGLLAHSHSWKRANSKAIENVTNAFEIACSPLTHPRQTLDVICVADLATWNSVCLSSDIFSAARPWTVITSMTCAAIGGESQSATFKPVGALIAALFQKMAWRDASLRDMAEYFRKANLMGSASGAQLRWPSSIYSAEVHKKIESGELVNDNSWNEWSLAIY